MNESAQAVVNRIEYDRSADAIKGPIEACERGGNATPRGADDAVGNEGHAR